MLPVLKRKIARVITRPYIPDDRFDHDQGRSRGRSALPAWRVWRNPTSLAGVLVRAGSGSRSRFAAVSGGLVRGLAADAGWQPRPGRPGPGGRPGPCRPWPVSALAVSALAVSALAVSALAVSALAVSA